MAQQKSAEIKLALVEKVWIFSATLDYSTKLAPTINYKWSYNIYNTL